MIREGDYDKNLTNTFGFLSESPAAPRKGSVRICNIAEADKQYA